MNIIEKQIFKFDQFFTVLWQVHVAKLYKEMKKII